MYVNHQIRAQLASRILGAHERFSAVQEAYAGLMAETSAVSSNFASVVRPEKTYDFQAMVEKMKLPLAKADAIIRGFRHFDKNSKHIEHFNDQLMIQFSILENQSITAERHNSTVKQLGYVSSLMRTNNVLPDFRTHALRFSIAVNLENLEDSTQALKMAQQTGYAGYQPLANKTLESFFSQSVKLDNFDGLAYLASYCETHNIDVSGWNMDRFRSAVDFYLNHAFNLNKILTFTRFYVHRAKGSISRDDPIIVNQDKQTSLK